MTGGKSIQTVNALGEVNGTQIFATTDQLDSIQHHVNTFTSPASDLREPMRRVEQAFLNEYAGFLIGNQCLDFQKQDGVTELEESILANSVERRLNDLLLEQEQEGVLTISRKPIYVSCVSNFTNFLDLFRKTIRSLELGVPVVILSRSNTAQHSFRWAEMLVELCSKETTVDPGMITYVSASLDDIQALTKNCAESTGNLYATCSRELASTIKQGYPKVVASTGGPNTLVAMDWTRSIEDAVRCSASIESSGQCTALRHVVVPESVNTSDVEQLLEGVSSVANAPEALANNVFDGVFAMHKGSPEPSGKYERHKTSDTFYRLGNREELPQQIHEYWRKVVVDVSPMDAKQNISSIADWLNTHQPISLAVNGSDRNETLKYGLELWQQTGMVVNTIGTPDIPALTCQARPQDAEVFGEFPPRRDLSRYTRFPVIVPSPTPAYDSSYTLDHLRAKSTQKISHSPQIQAIVDAVSNTEMKGYCTLLWKYLVDATQQNPKVGFGTNRTALWGLQRPPLSTTTHLRCDESSTWADLAPTLVLFEGTNARDQYQVSVDNSNQSLLELLEKHDIPHIAEDRPTFEAKLLSPGDNVVSLPCPELQNETMFPMVGQFTSLFLPIGHIKSTLADDQVFIDEAKPLAKWLKTIQNN